MCRACTRAPPLVVRNNTMQDTARGKEGRKWEISRPRAVSFVICTQMSSCASMQQSYMAELTTPEQWEQIRVLLRDLPSSDSISRSANSIEKEAQIVKEFLSQALPLPQLFLALDEATRQDNRERVGQASKAILRVFTSSIGPGLLDDQIVLPNLNAGLAHPDAEVRKLTTRVLHKALTMRRNDDTLLALLLRSEVVASLARGVSDEEISVSQHAADALVELMRQSRQASADHSSVIMAVIGEAATSDRVLSSSVFPLRYGELVAKGLATSESVLSAAIATGAVDLLFKLLEGKDVLLQFSALELLDHLAQTRWGVAYLFRRGTVARLLTLATGKADYMTNTPGGEPDPILGGTSLRVLGSLYRTVFSQPVDGAAGASPEVLEAASSSLDPTLIRAVLSTVIQYAESTRDSDRLSALQAICGFAGNSPVALRLILEDPVLLSAWLDVRSMRTEMKAASLHSVARVLRGRPASASPTTAAGQEQAADPAAAPSGGEGEQEVVELRKLLFNRLGEVNTRAAGSSMAFLMGQLKAPIEPIRNAVYDVLAAVAEQRSGWGLRTLFGHGGFQELMLNRRTEMSKEGKEWKFAVVEAAMRCEDKGILADELLEELTKFLKQGPFYVGEQRAEVDTLT